MIKEITKQDIALANFKPESHTVAFSDEGDWIGYYVGNKLVGVLCVCDRHGGKYISSCFTQKEFRSIGVMTSLVKYVIMKYPTDILIAHCLISSRNIFKKLDFIEYKCVNYRHGTQYFMRRDNSGKTEN